MDIHTFKNLIQNPKKISEDETTAMGVIAKEYPYFQLAKATYLKGLKQNNNFKYNKTLKSTAAITVDRSVLFDFITDFEFTATKSSTKKESVSVQEPSKDNDKKAAFLETEKLLEIGQPLNFNKNEVHSFNEWLQLSSKKTIQRDQEKNNTVSTLSKNKDLIDQFIDNNPSIKPLNKDSKTISIAQNTYQESELMTETLAKVYLEQNKYSNAIKAYEILILKYPEKSGFFADQIKKIEYLKNK